ncbi:MAG TPA: hypothetical protein VGD40_22085 [Chryseosolibacter sp.]
MEKFLSRLRFMYGPLYARHFKNVFLHIVLALLPIACSNYEQNDSKVKLLLFKYSPGRSAPKEDYFDSVRFEKIIKQGINGDTIQIDVEVGQSGCLGFTGDIKVQNDSLILLYSTPGDTACATLERYDLSFKILDRSKRDYKVGLGYVY